MRAHMTDDAPEFEKRSVESAVPSHEAAPAKAEIEARCKTAGLTIEKAIPPFEGLRVGMRCGRDTRWVYVGSGRNLIDFALIPFERFTFLSGYEAICSYQDGFIEAAFRPTTHGLMPSSFTYRRLFGVGTPGESLDLAAVNLVIEQADQGVPRIEISLASEIFGRIVRTPLRQRLTLKLTGCNVARHDHALSLLKKMAGSVFFQIDLLSDVPLVLERERRPSFGAGRPRKKVKLQTELQYPKTEFDDAPLSLYWYARSASGMPLLQFLAFYQVIEFYFPIYSQAEAQRKVKAMLKDPAFRGDRDADIGKLLSAIKISRSGGYGDERSQLRAALQECVDPDLLRGFLEAVPDRKEFYTAKAKTQTFHKIPLASSTADLRADVAERIYDIRCKIVHTKNDSGDGEFELLLPFSTEAEQLSFDIELAQYLAQAVLIAGSLPFQVGH
jgi:hypothetical protein